MFTRRALVPPAVVDAKGVLDAVVRWAQSLNDKGALEVAQARIAADQGIAFPATQVTSTDPNTLDDYEEGTWTAVLTFATPGNLSVGYSIQGASYTKIGRVVTVDFAISTSAFTHTTASGNLQVSGLPFTSSSDSGYASFGAVNWSGITKAGYTQVNARISANVTTIDFVACASASALSPVVVADVPSGGTVSLLGSVKYRV